MCDAPFVDLNVAPARRTCFVVLSSLDAFWLPTLLAEADIVVSMPKMKTHHWAGVTLSFKNCSGACQVACTGGRRTRSTG